MCNLHLKGVVMNLEAVWSRVLRDTSVDHYSIHGPEHWARVERNGLYIAEQTGADKTIVRLFALFHDCRRINDAIDPGHGLRGAKYAAKIKHELINISADDFDKLYYACEWHTDKTETDDITVAACWDADRLDICRVGYIVEAQYMNSKPAKEIAESGDFHPLERIQIRNWEKLMAPIVQT